MKRAGLAITIIAICAPLASLANGNARPPLPDWQNDATNCSWHWREGGGLALWAQTCTFNGTTWQVQWDEGQAAFVTRSDDTDAEIAVQAFALPDGGDIAALSERLIADGNLDADAACTWQPIALRPAPRIMAFYVLAPTDPAALDPTPDGEVPAPICGPYGASTHGVRYFITDMRWPDQAIFVEEGQERPLFDPSSITRLP
jgi:hypothetical protein